MRAPVSVLSPVLRRSFTVASPPPVRVTLCQGTSTRDEVEYVEVATDTGISNADKTVQAVVDYCDVGTVYDPPATTTPVVPTLEDAVLDIDLVALGPTSLTSLESSVDPPNDFTVDGSLAARSELGDAGPPSETGPEETSPIGPSLIDSDDELIAPRLPGYPNSFKTCEVSALQFLSFTFLFHIFLFIFIRNSDFTVFLSIFHCLEFFKIGCFFSFQFSVIFCNFHLFYIL